MSLSYAEAKIQQVSELAKGNRAKVTKVIEVLVKQDHKLLMGLTQKYLRGIIAAHVESVLEKAQSLGVKEKTIAIPKEKDIQDNKKPSQVAFEEHNDFGVEILRAASADSAEIFGFDTGAPIPPRKQASQAHIDAILQMAERSKSRFNKKS